MTKENRRSDAIRARRAGPSAHLSAPARKTAPRSTSSRSTPRKPVDSGNDQYQAPVLVRASQRHIPITTANPRRSKRGAPVEPRRRYDVALSVPGAEIRLPSMPQVEIGWRWLSLLLVVLFGWLLYYLWTSPSFQVKPVQVKGLQRVTAAELNGLLGVTGEPIFILNAAQLEEQIRLAFPEFSQVAVQIDFPNVVKVDVTERVPVLIWDNGGQVYLIDQEGFAFPLRYELNGSSGDYAGFPLVHASGLPPMPPQTLDSITKPIIPLLGLRVPNAGSAPQLLPGEMVSAVQALSAHAPGEVEMVYEGHHGLGWRDERGWTVFFGDAKNMEMKLRMYETLVARLAAEEIQPELISVEHIHAPYYRLEH